jgi:VIT1/CCC1 family predicted Fe2+/Mn2+ transporter
LTAHDALAAHVDAELRLDPDDLANPQRAAASAASFTVGALLALPAILVPPASCRRPVTFIAVLIALVLAGALSARIGGSRVGRAVLRVVIGGPDDYRQLVPVVRCLPQASTVDETPGLSSSLVTATG